MKKKARPAPKPKRATRAKKSQPKAAIGPVMTAAELAKRHDCNTETIRRYSKLPWAPKQARHGRWSVVDFDRFMAYVEARGGPKALKQEAAEMGAAGISTDPAAITGAALANLPGGLPPPAETAAAAEAATATTPHELLKLSTQQLDRARKAEEIIQRRLANQERKGKLIPRQLVQEIIFGRAQVAANLARQISLELPAQLQGLDRPECEKLVRAAFDGFFRAIARAGDAVRAEEVKPAPPAAGEIGKPILNPPPPADAKGGNP